MNSIIVEDQRHAQLILEKFTADVGHLQLLGTYHDATSAMEVLKAGNVDLMFLDVNLPKISGIEFLKTLQHPPYVIITTAYSEYALEGYELNLVDYLLKPFSFQRFLQAVAKVPALTSEKAINTDLYMFIKTMQGHRKVELDSIFRLSADLDCTEIWMKDERIVSSERLKHWSSELPGDIFIRVHKSHIINRNKISRLDGNRIYLKDGNMVPLGRSYKDDFMKKVLKK
ncbi:MAG: LytTR family DNA-binding domain-containing protein [Bacteroidota bacterium]